MYFAAEETDQKEPADQQRDLSSRAERSRKKSRNDEHTPSGQSTDRPAGRRGLGHFEPSQQLGAQGIAANKQKRQGDEIAPRTSFGNGQQKQQRDQEQHRPGSHGVASSGPGEPRPRAASHGKRYTDAPPIRRRP